MKNKISKKIQLALVSTILVPAMVSAAGLDLGMDTSVPGVANTAVVNLNTSTNIVNTNVNVTGTVNTGTVTSVKILSSAQVSNQADLETVSVNVIANNENVADINIEDGANGESEVEVKYKHKGRFLGMFDINVTSNTTVTAKSGMDAEVDSSLSWWSFLITDVNYNEETLESSIKSNTAIKTNAQINASANAKAVIAETLIAELQVNAAANTTINQ